VSLIDFWKFPFPSSTHKSWDFSQCRYIYIVTMNDITVTAVILFHLLYLCLEGKYITIHTSTHTLYHTTLHYTTLHYTTLHTQHRHTTCIHTTLHYTTLHYTHNTHTLHYTTLHYTHTTLYTTHTLHAHTLHYTQHTHTHTHTLHAHTHTLHYIHTHTLLYCFAINPHMYIY